TLLHLSGCPRHPEAADRRVVRSSGRAVHSRTALGRQEKCVGWREPSSGPGNLRWRDRLPLIGEKRRMLFLVRASIPTEGRVAPAHFFHRLDGFYNRSGRALASRRTLAQCAAESGLEEPLQVAALYPSHSKPSRVRSLG